VTNVVIKVHDKVVNDGWLTL